MQRGNRLAALDGVHGAARPTTAFAVAVTGAHACRDAVAPRGFTIEYDATAAVRRVRCTLGAVR